MYKYEEIAQDIALHSRRRTQGLRATPDRFVELCDKYDASKSTIQQVITELTAGSPPWLGMFVKTFAMESDLYWRITTGSINYKEDPNEEQEVTSTSMTLPSFAHRQRFLTCLTWTCLCLLGEARDAHQVGAFAVEYVYIPIDLAAGFKYEDATGSIIKFASDKLGLKVSSIHKSVRAAMPTTEERARLQISFGQPLLEMERVAFLADGRPYEYALTRYRGDKFEYRAIDNL